MLIGQGHASKKKRHSRSGTMWPHCPAVASGCTRVMVDGRWLCSRHVGPDSGYHSHPEPREQRIQDKCSCVKNSSFWWHCSLSVALFWLLPVFMYFSFTETPRQASAASPRKIKQLLISISKVPLLFILLFFFICSLDTLSSAFQLAGGKYNSHCPPTVLIITQWVDVWQISWPPRSNLCCSS